MSVHKDIKNKTKDGRMWYFVSSYVDQNNKRRLYKSKKFKTQSEAKEAEAVYMLQNNKFANIKFGTVAIDYFENLSAKRKESTLYTYKNAYNSNIRDFFEEMNINTIEIQTLKAWRNIIEKKNFSIRYKNKLHCIIKNILDYAMKYYNLDKNVESIMGPFEINNDVIKKDDDKLRYITVEEFSKFISGIDSTMWKTFFSFLFFTGCRKGEVQALTWEDIDFQNNVISIYKTLTVKTPDNYKITNTKNKLNRKVIINTSLKKQLLDYKREMKRFTDFNEKWFVFGGTRFLAQTTIDNNKHKYFEKANIPEITIHEFRHSHVSLLINEYVQKSKNNSMKVDTAKFFLMMSERMGHTIEVMQKTYMHLFPSIQDEIVDLLNNI